MPRAPRCQEAGYLHHVVCRGNDRQNIFRDRSDFLQYIHFLEKARKLYPLAVYNFVLMDNHIHLLVEPLAEGNLSKVMEETSKAYAKYFNKKYNKTGHLFQGRFKSFLIQQERYFFCCSRYIDLNPVKAGKAKKPEDYPWSGYAQLCHGKKLPLTLNFHELYKELGKTEQERRIGYRVIVQTAMGEELDLMKRNAGVLGDREFKKKVRK